MIKRIICIVLLSLFVLPICAFAAPNNETTGFTVSLGADIKGGDMFENVMTYAELEAGQKPSVSEPEQILTDNEIKPKKEITAYYVLAAAVLTVIIAVILIVIRNKKR